MTGWEAITTALQATQRLLDSYVGDLTDADILTRPCPRANHVAWQLGHLILTERFLVASQLPAATVPELPAGFTKSHGQDAAWKDDGFLPLDEYLRLFGEGRAASIAALGGLTDADLDRPATGKVAASAPTLGAVFLLVSNHTLMHAGQFTVIRRALGKPVLF